MRKQNMMTRPMNTPNCLMAGICEDNNKKKEEKKRIPDGCHVWHSNFVHEATSCTCSNINMLLVTLIRKLAIPNFISQLHMYV